MLVLNGVPVIVDATANLRAYRERARDAIPRFLEVHVRCPLAVCQARDPKGIYRRGAEGTARDVPGVSAPFEPPLKPEVVVDGEREDPAAAARRIVSALEKQGSLPGGSGEGTEPG
jgi:adenylylsulfate kinase-like enzyme